MKSLIASTIVASSVSILSSTIAAAPADQPAMSCVERLEMPQYPGLPRRARVRGDVEATAILNSDGSVKDVQFAARPPSMGSLAYFHGEVEQALRRSKFSSACQVRAITIVFEFRLVGNGVEDRYRAVAFKYPNRFEIVASDPIVNP